MMKSTASLTIAVICAMLFAATDATDATDAANDAYTESCALLQTLGSSVFNCTSQTDACTLKYYECDSVVDCPDSSDEDHCEAEHEKSCVDDFDGKFTKNMQPLEKFKCDDGMCILGCYRCDNRRDCVDGSDEHGCTENIVRPPCY